MIRIVKQFTQASIRPLNKGRCIQYICMYRAIEADRVIDAIRYYPRCKITHRDAIALSTVTVFTRELFNELRISIIVFITRFTVFWVAVSTDVIFKCKFFAL